MGLIDTIVMGIFGTILLQRDERKTVERNEKKRTWLTENGYDIEKQLEIDRWCRDNVEVAIEEAYQCAYRTTLWEEVYREWMRGNKPVKKSVCKYHCEKAGIEYFDFDSPPTEYKEIA